MPYIYPNKEVGEVGISNTTGHVSVSEAVELVTPLNVDN
jgi:hypothetical protein